MQNIIATLNSLWEKLSMYMYPLKMSTTDLVEIVIITFLFYYVLAPFFVGLSFRV